MVFTIFEGMDWKVLGMTDALPIAAERGVGAQVHLQRPGGYLVHLLLRGEPTEGIIDTKFQFSGKKRDSK